MGSRLRSFSLLGLCVRARLLMGVACIAALASCATPGADSGFPTKQSINSEIERFSKVMQVQTSNVKGFQDLAPHRGGLFVVRVPQRELCAVVANRGHYSSSYVMKFMKEMGVQGEGPSFAVAHEITHCLYSKEQSLSIIQRFLPDIDDPALASELLADASGLVYLKRTGLDYAQALAVVQRHRKWNVLSARYNTGAHLSEQLLASIEKEVFFLKN